ncbi:MAG: hypothetical protein AB8G15_08645 [Saprospiraceae bacterium]
MTSRYKFLLVCKNFLFCALFLVGTNALYAQKYSNEFLSIGVGAKGQSLGNAVVAGVDDVTAGFWNPAGLMNIDPNAGVQFGAMHAEWFAGVGKYDYLGLAMPISNKERALGLSVIRFAIDDIPNTLSLYDDDGTVNYDNVVPFSSADYAFLLSYAQGVYTDFGKLSVGGNIKVVHRNIGPFATAWGFGLDAGVQFRTKNWHFGFMAKDFTNTFNAWQFEFTEEEKEVLQLTNNDIPINSLEVTRPQFILGAAYQRDFGKFGLMAELDFTASSDGFRNTLIRSNTFSVDPSFGIEANYGKFVFFRAGINNFQKDRDFEEEFWTVQPNLGVGLKIFNLYIDYAFTDIGDQRNKTYSHVISLKLAIDFKRFRKPKKNQ